MKNSLSICVLLALRLSRSSLPNPIGLGFTILFPVLLNFGSRVSYLACSRFNKCTYAGHAHRDFAYFLMFSRWWSVSQSKMAMAQSAISRIARIGGGEAPSPDFAIFEI